ncbi:MAG: hypothetical protein CL778_03180 [Chloroflexi bacterium]|nr:hypothetical protein [Chloroflexota bacterium]|tara:strand:- start:25 stop:384 length:360 start_codon:yes stop_codon:yes gene_type:complete
MNESIEQGILVAIQGMIVVFIVLILLALFIVIFKFFDQKLYPLPNNKNTQDIKYSDPISPEKIAAIALSIFLRNNKEISPEKFVSNELKDSVNPWVIQGRQIILNQENSTSNNSWRKAD